MPSTVGSVIDRNEILLNGQRFPIKGPPRRVLTSLFAPKISIGISNWWNVTFQQIVGSRHMGWLTNELSTHHRNEGAHSDFDNALGGYLGETK